MGLNRNRFRYDLYINYSEIDRWWVEQNLLPEFRREGFRYFTNNLHDEVGKSKLNEIQRGVQSSRVTLIIFTQDYLNDQISRTGMDCVRGEDPDGRNMRCIPFILKPCPSLPDFFKLLTSLNYADANGTNEQRRVINKLITHLHGTLENEVENIEEKEFTHIFQVQVAADDNAEVEVKQAFDAINSVNRRFQQSKSPARLQITSISDIQSEAEEYLEHLSDLILYDILIFIFRIGFNPEPKTFAHYKDKTYLVATAALVEHAIQSRNKHHRGRPIIFFYVNEDWTAGVQSTIASRRIRQETMQYFQSFTSLGEFFFTFKANSLQRLIEAHLAEQVQWVLDQEAIDNLSSESSPELFEILDWGTDNEEEVDLISIWFSLISLQKHPFLYMTGEQEDTSDLNKYFVRPPGITMPELLQHKEPIVVFANRGCGKSAICALLLSYCYPNIKRHDVFCISVDRNSLQDALQCQNENSNLSSWRLAQILVRKANPLLRQRLDERRAELVIDGELQSLQDQLSSIVQIAKTECSSSTDLNTATFLQQFSNLAKGLGFNQVICLVDQLDEVKPEQGSRFILEKVLPPLMDIRLREGTGVFFRYFISAEFEDEMRKLNEIFRLDRCNVKHLKWGKKDLLSLISQRLIASSKNKSAPYRSVGELFDPSSEYARTIDQEIVDLADGSPRAVIWLIDRLFYVHLQNGSSQRYLEAKEWDQVKFEFLVARDSIIGSKTEHKGSSPEPETLKQLWVIDDRVFSTKGEIILPMGRYHALLVTLINADGRVCSDEELWDACNPDEEPAAVGRAIEALIPRLKKILIDQGVNPQFIQRVRGRGYRIQW